LDEIPTKVLRVFFLAIHSHLYTTALPRDLYFNKVTQPLMYFFKLTQPVMYLYSKVDVQGKAERRKICVRKSIQIPQF